MGIRPANAILQRVANSLATNQNLIYRFNMMNRNDSQQHEPLAALSIQTKLENALATENPIDSLRQYVLELLQLGYSKEAIYQAFLAYHTLLQEQDRGLEADVLGDVMDMVTGWYVGRELELK